jgi:hypothetical protein
MPLTKHIVAAAIGVALLSVPAKAEMSWGTGSDTCGTFLKSARASETDKGYSIDGVRYYMEISWAEGFIAARNAQFAEAMDTKFGNDQSVPHDLLTGLDAPAMQVWMKNYCQANPLDTVEAAAGNFTLEVLHRLPKPQTGNAAGHR